MASIIERRRDGKVFYYVQWFDAFKGKGRSGLRKVSCKKEGAVTVAQRLKMLRQYVKKEEARRREVAERGRRPKYDTPVSQLIETYLAELEAQSKIREERGGRAGVAVGTFREYSASLELFRQHVDSLTAGDLDGEVIRQFKHSLVTQPGRGGRIRSPSTVNKHLRQVRTLLYRFGDADPPYFRDHPLVLFKRALSRVQEGRRLPVLYPPSTLKQLLEAALDHDAETCIWHAADPGRDEAGQEEDGCEGHDLRCRQWPRQKSRIEEGARAELLLAHDPAVYR